MNSGKLWPWLVVALLVSNALVMMVLVHYARGDASHQVVDDYYRKAVAYDDVIAEKRASAALGWQLDARVEATAGQPARVVVSVHDRAGAPVTGARVTLSTFHQARSGRVLTAVLAAAGEGTYTTQLPMLRPGLWQLDLVVERDAARFTGTVHRDLRPRSASATTTATR